ncbi:class I SAM-dependent methyltransferase [Falsiroseomonas selenitidurans]|uniref:Methyltransferase domain-containing protein n=1 Tax=Falsiroseomonas selenitidurans TaxID=2716335 RepID=A0ABX1DZ65_9PROT|nr:class I SAM-dependent methyltransferase [Falsiroseomonas selenitidurans]NKC30121.1 methyltransferase domain-containing protein [Falsiroseomonas selenitidurans]
MTLPYIDQLLAQLARGNPQLERSFGRHIHWGYWPDPAAARPDQAEDYGRAAERLSLELLDLAGIAPGMRVLDAGCGFGGTLACLDERVERLDMTGLNIDPRQLQRAARVARPRPGSTLRFVAADACTLPFADASFDRVLAVECIFHFPSRAAFLAEVRRVLRPGGALVISDFVPSPFFAPFGRLPKLRALRRINVLGECDTSCTAAGYRALAARAGLRVTTLRDITRHTLPTYAFLKHLAQQSGGSRLVRGFSAPLIGLLDFYGRSGLLKYSLLRFDRG